MILICAKCGAVYVNDSECHTCQRSPRFTWNIGDRCHKTVGSDGDEHWMCGGKLVEAVLVPKDEYELMLERLTGER